MFVNTVLYLYYKQYIVIKWGHTTVACSHLYSTPTVVRHFKEFKKIVAFVCAVYHIWEDKLFAGHAQCNGMCVPFAQLVSSEHPSIHPFIHSSIHPSIHPSKITQTHKKKRLNVLVNVCYPLDAVTPYKLNDHLISDISKFRIKREPWIIRRKKSRDYIYWKPDEKRNKSTTRIQEQWDIILNAKGFHFQDPTV
jgi:hypothetical protein